MTNFNHLTLHKNNIKCQSKVLVSLEDSFLEIWIKKRLFACLMSSMTCKTCFQIEMKMDRIVIRVSSFYIRVEEKSTVTSQIQSLTSQMSHVTSQNQSLTSQMSHVTSQNQSLTSQMSHVTSQINWGSIDRISRD